MKVLNDSAYNIFAEGSKNIAAKYYHTWCGSPHLFLALMQFLNKFKGEKEVGEVYSKLKDTLNKHNVDGTKFKDSFLEICPAGEPVGEDEEFEISSDDEMHRIWDFLTAQANKTKQTGGIKDLIAALFADKAYKIYSIFAAALGSDTEADKLFNEIYTEFHKSIRASEGALDKVKELTNLNEYVKKHPQVVIGGNTDKYIDMMQVTLNSRIIKSPILVGPAGTGKTALVYELAQRINEGKVSESLKNKIIYEISPAQLVGGTRFRGDLEEKISNLMKLLSEDENAILFCDELHTLTTMGSSSDDSNSIGNMIKPFLSRGEITMIGATTNGEYAKNIENDKAFARRFNKILINEPTKAETKEILKGLKKVELDFFGKEIADELVNRIVDLASQYTLDQANPAKSLNMMDLAFAYSKTLKEQNKEIEMDDVINSVKLKYDIHISETKYQDATNELRKMVLGQDKALDKISEDLKVVETGLNDPEGPLFSMILAGPSGTGKTYSSEIIAEKFFGSKDKNLIKINCGELSSDMDVSKLTGSAPGYVGYDDEAAIIKQIKQAPNSVVLFDEIEKAAQPVQKVLLNILDKGEMVDNKGNKVSFRNAIIIFTTNAGYTKDFAEEVGIGILKKKGTTEDINKALKDYFKPEFLGRIDDVIVFDTLPDSIMDDLIERYRKQYEEQINQPIKFTKKSIETIKEAADIKHQGARGLRKAVKKEIIKIIK